MKKITGFIVFHILFLGHLNSQVRIYSTNTYKLLIDDSKGVFELYKSSKAIIQNRNLLPSVEIYILFAGKSQRLNDTIVCLDTLHIPREKFIYKCMDRFKLTCIKSIHSTDTMYLSYCKEFDGTEYMMYWNNGMKNGTWTRTCKEGTFFSVYFNDKLKEEFFKTWKQLSFERKW